MNRKSAKTLQGHLGGCDRELARRAEMLWALAAPIHARQTRVDANEGGEAHCRRVEQYIRDLICYSGRVDEYLPIELFLLSCSACCHDFDKGLGTVFRALHFRVRVQYWPNTPAYSGNQLSETNFLFFC